MLEIPLTPLGPLCRTLRACFHIESRDHAQNLETKQSPLQLHSINISRLQNIQDYKAESYLPSANDRLSSILIRI